jgi:hypothetical protein
LERQVSRQLPHQRGLVAAWRSGDQQDFAAHDVRASVYEESIAREVECLVSLLAYVN